MCTGQTSQQHMGRWQDRAEAGGVLKYQASFCQKINIYVHLQSERGVPRELPVTIVNPLCCWITGQWAKWVENGGWIGGFGLGSGGAGKVVRTFTPIAIKSSEVGNMIA